MTAARAFAALVVAVFYGAHALQGSSVAFLAAGFVLLAGVLLLARHLLRPQR